MLSVDALIQTDDMDKYTTGERRVPVEPVVTKLCTLCRVEQARGWLLLDMRNDIKEEERGIDIWTIVEKHLCLDLDKCVEKIAQELLICESCWDIVYKFHVFYGMVHENHAKMKLHGKIERDPLTSSSKANACIVQDDDKNDPLCCTELMTIKIESGDSMNDAHDGEDEEESVSIPASTVVDRESNDESDNSSREATNECFPKTHNRTGISSKRGIQKDEPKRRRKKESTSLKEEKCEPDHEVLDFYKRIVCEICDLERMARGVAGIEYNTLKELNHHMRNEHNTHAAIRCPICTNKYRGRVQLIKHKEMHLNPDNFRCSECSEVHHNMKEHVKQKHSDKPYTCSECGKSYAFRARLAVHIRMTHAARDVICDQCKKPFSKYTIDEHKKAVHLASFICEYCPKTFKQRFWLNRHMEEHNETGSVNRAATCTICGAVVKNKYILVSHMRRMHSEQSAVSCKSCGKSFKAKQDLNKHIRNVCTDRSFACAACGKQFKQKVKLNEHMTTHTGMSLYVCNFCPQTFKYESYFYIHRKKVHPEQWLEMKQKRKEGLHQKIQRIQDNTVESDSNT
uniref:C2H2-type domain-containing protein n=1 Tax=Anopheles atroparvus TaxID=41427 RepID=A0AAG5D9A4_ANOAO